MDTCVTVTTTATWAWATTATGGRGLSLGVRGISWPPPLWVAIAQRMPLTTRAQVVVGALSADMLRHLPPLEHCADWRSLGEWHDDKGYQEAYGDGVYDGGGGGSSGGGGAAVVRVLAVAPLDFRRLEAPLRALRDCAVGVTHHSVTKTDKFGKSFFRGLLLRLEIADLALQGLVPSAGGRGRNTRACSSGGQPSHVVASERQMALWREILEQLDSGIPKTLMSEETQEVMELLTLLKAKYDPYFPTPAAERGKNKKQKIMSEFFGGS